MNAQGKPFQSNVMGILGLLTGQLARLTLTLALTGPTGEADHLLTVSIRAGQAGMRARKYAKIVDLPRTCGLFCDTTKQNPHRYILPHVMISTIYMSDIIPSGQAAIL